MSVIERVREKILKIQIINKEEIIRYELYAILTTIILSKDIFIKNKDVVEFLHHMNIVIKPYMQKNRTAMLSKALRVINQSSLDDINTYKKILSNIFCVDTIDRKSNKTNNYMTELLEKYSRESK